MEKRSPGKSPRSPQRREDCCSVVYILLGAACNRRSADYKDPWRKCKNMKFCDPIDPAYPQLNANKICFKVEILLGPYQQGAGCDTILLLHRSPPYCDRGMDSFSTGVAQHKGRFLTTEKGIYSERFYAIAGCSLPPYPRYAD